MTTALDQIRQQYPQYANVPDRQLADALYTTFYAGKLDKPADYAQLGMTTGDCERWRPLDALNESANHLRSGAYKGSAGWSGVPGTLREAGVAMGAARKCGGKGGMRNADAPADNQSPFPGMACVES